MVHNIRGVHGTKDVQQLSARDVHWAERGTLYYTPDLNEADTSDPLVEFDRIVSVQTVHEKHEGHDRREYTRSPRSYCKRSPP